MVHSWLFPPKTELPVTVDENIIAFLIWLPVVVDELMLEPVIWVAITWEEIIMDLVHSEFHILLSRIVQSINSEFEQGLLERRLLVMLHSVAETSKAVRSNK